jgi:hypothetical protein
MSGNVHRIMSLGMPRASSTSMLLVVATARTGIVLGPR